jgi:hypothetical protein
MENEAEATRGPEIIAVVILLLAGVATSWNSYQATRWMSVQDARYGKANALHAEAARASTAAGVSKTTDALAFQNWLMAYATGNKPLQNFYQQRFRPEFSIAFENWLTEEPLMKSEATPFASPEYRLESAEKAARLEEAAAQSFHEGETASSNAEAYTLSSVSLAFALLLVGIAKMFRSARLKLVLLAAGAVSCGIALFRIATMPIQ